MSGVSFLQRSAPVSYHTATLSAANGWIERPGDEHDSREDEWSPPDVDAIAYRKMCGDRPSIGEERARVRPLGEAGKARDEQRRRARNLPDAENDQEVGGIAQMLHDEVVNVRYLQNIPHATRRKLKRDDQRGGPIDDRADPNRHDVIAD